MFSLSMKFNWLLSNWACQDALILLQVFVEADESIQTSWPDFLSPRQEIEQSYLLVSCLQLADHLNKLIQLWVSSFVSEFNTQ